MVINLRKNKYVVSVWFKDVKEYNNLKEALEHNEQEKVINILYSMLIKGDL